MSVFFFSLFVLLSLLYRFSPLYFFSSYRQIETLLVGVTTTFTNVSSSVPHPCPSFIFSDYKKDVSLFFWTQSSFRNVMTGQRNLFTKKSQLMLFTKSLILVFILCQGKVCLYIYLKCLWSISIQVTVMIFVQ